MITQEKIQLIKNRLTKNVPQFETDDWEDMMRDTDFKLFLKSVCGAMDDYLLLHKPQQEVFEDDGAYAD